VNDSSPSTHTQQVISEMSLVPATKRNILEKLCEKTK